ncbi:MAG: BACON domain-containing protein [Bacteroidales bacterium]|nr:BACON domain-containing protein [Bacteroidales bacterium]
MKLRNIFTALLAALTLTVSCEDEKVAYLDEIKVSQSYVAIDAAGGSTEITLNAKDEWSFSGVPEWLKVEPASGAAGKDITVTFSATAAKATKEAMLYLNCGSKSQIINVIQMTEKVDLPISTYKQIAAGQDGTVYRAKGTCTDIYNTEYGNWHLIDATGDLTIYGTLDKNGATKKFKSLGIEAGDIVTVEGPKKTYNGTVQLTDVTVIAIEKSLIKIESLTPAEALPKEGGVLEVALTCKGTNMEVVLPDAAKSWVSVAGISSNGKEASVKFSVAANSEGKRQADIVIKTVSGGKDYTAQFTLTQDGAIIDATVAEVLKAEDGLTQYRVSGYISKDKNSEYGNIYIKDATGEIYVYGVLDAKGQSKQWNNMGIHEGDIITVVGPKTSFNKEPQMKNVSVESFKTVKDLTIKDFVATADDKETYYRISGKVSGIKDGDVYGNFDLTDATGTVYVYGLVAGYGGEKKKFQELGIKDGDEITIVGVSTSFNGKKQVGNAFLVTKANSGTVTPGPTPTPGEVISIVVDDFPEAYPKEEAIFTVSGQEVYLLNVANFGSGIQMKKGGSYIANAKAFSKKILSVKLTAQEGKKANLDMTLFAGSSAKPESNEITASKTETTATFDLSSGDYKFFTLKNASLGAAYFSKIEITLAK